MTNLFILTVIVFSLLTILLVVAIVFSPDVYVERHQWRVQKDDGSVDWPRVDAGKFVFFVLGRAWGLLLALLVLTYFWLGDKL